MISVVVPFGGMGGGDSGFEDARLGKLRTLLEALNPECDEIEVVVVVDRELTESLGDSVKVACTKRSRGQQIATGIQASENSWIWVLHADTEGVLAAKQWLLAMSCEQNAQPGWGRFDVLMPGVPLVPALMNLRSRLTRICTGDQGMFFHRDVLDSIGGFPQQPLMEDIEVSRRLRRQPPWTFHAPQIQLVADGTKWLKEGWLWTVLRMWWFRLRYFFGASPDTLFKAYYRDSH